MGNSVSFSSQSTRPPPPTKEQKEESKKGRNKETTHINRFGKRRKQLGPDPATKLPSVTPTNKCGLRLMKLERIADWLTMEEELLLNLIRLKPDKPTEEEAKKEEIDTIRGSPIGVGVLEEIIDDDHAIVTSSTGLGESYVRIFSIVDKDLMEPGCTVLLKQQQTGLVGSPSAIVGVLSDEVDTKTTLLKLNKAPKETYADVGGLESQIQELKESVELPLTHPELYEEMGIVPPKGVILYGPPGTGKTLLAKAVANQTSATFIRVVGSELVQKHAGEGAKLVREMFKMAEQYAPSIIFLDEIDSVGSKRYDTSCRGEREIQRTLLELLNQLDGFEARKEVKVIMATNRIDTLDPALIRPGRIDRKIEIPSPDEKNRRKIFQLHSAHMNIAHGVSMEEFLKTSRDLSGADIKSICAEAGMAALRARRTMVTMEDFQKARDSLFHQKKNEAPEGLYL